jgi:hypothetical protein
MSYVWYVVVEKYRNIAKIRRPMIQRGVIGKLLMSAGLEKEKHKANFATFMNVTVSQR